VLVCDEGRTIWRRREDDGGKRLLPLILFVIPSAGNTGDRVFANGDLIAQRCQFALFRKAGGKRLVDVELAEKPQPEGEGKKANRGAKPQFPLAISVIQELRESLAKGSSIKSLLLIHGQCLPVTQLLLAQLRNAWSIGRLPPDGGVGEVRSVNVALTAVDAPSDDFAVAYSWMRVFSADGGFVDGHMAAGFRGGGGEATERVPRGRLPHRMQQR